MKTLFLLLVCASSANAQIFPTTPLPEGFTTAGNHAQYVPTPTPMPTPAALSDQVKAYVLKIPRTQAQEDAVGRASYSFCDACGSKSFITTGLDVLVNASLWYDTDLSVSALENRRLKIVNDIMWSLPILIHHGKDK